MRATPSTTTSAPSPRRPASTSPATSSSTATSASSPRSAGRCSRCTPSRGRRRAASPWSRSTGCSTSSSPPTPGTLDQNLYQAVKGMSAAATVVRPGGRIVCAAECRDGFPDHGSFREVLASADSPRALLESIAARERTVPDQWQVQVLARVLDRAQVAVRTDFLDADDLRSAHLLPCEDVRATVDEALAAAGPDARVCVLPEGPLTLPYVAA
ncbi:hypothetical protein ACFQV8_31400 [Pseudonocardia benzenivorans]